MTSILLIALALVILAGIYALTRKKAGGDISVPLPATLRSDLLYGYYGCETGQVDDVSEHTNLHWECQFNGTIPAADNIRRMARFTVLDVSEQLFERFQATGKNFRLRENAEVRLRSYFDYLQMVKALHYVKVLVPLDEPNTNCRTPGDLLQACTILRAVARDYLELDGEKLGCIYAAKPESFTCIEQFDWVGVDDYDAKSSILAGSYRALCAAKRPDAQTILLPGGAFGQDPTPFMNFAHGNLEVAAVVPFCWFGPREPADKWVGIRDSGELRGKYEAQGNLVVWLANRAATT